MSTLRNMYSSELFRRYLVRHHGPKLPAVIVANPLIENYKAALVAAAKLERVYLARKIARCVSPVHKIMVAVCHEFDISDAEMMGRSTKIRYALPRQVAMYLARTHVKKNERHIAAIFGKDHTSVRNAHRLIPARVAANSQLAERVGAVEALLYAA